MSYLAKNYNRNKISFKFGRGSYLFSDNKEKYLKAALRELKEETSITSVELIKEIDEWYTYELPEYLLGKIWKGKFRGQKQKWFIMKFLGNENEIKLNTKNPEFFEWKWIKIDELTNVVVKFKFDVYKKIYEELKKL